MSSLPAARSPSWRWATRSRPGRKPEHDSQNDPQNGQPGLTRKTEKAQWDQLAAGPGVEALLAEHESVPGTFETSRCDAAKSAYEVKAVVQRTSSEDRI